MYKGLPEMCYSTNPLDEDELIIIKRGEEGYYPVNKLSDAYLCNKDKNNELIGVTKAQELAMVSGSMFGWDSPGANPEVYEKGAEDDCEH
jgi:hypothetical protein